MLRALYLLPTLAVLSASAQSFEITAGPAPYQVVQRDGDNRAAFRLEGTARQLSSRPVEARLVRAGLVVPGFDWRQAGAVSGDRWQAEIARVPTGGPYRLEIRITGAADIRAIEPLLVGDLWMLAGQSNMQGVGNLQDLPLPSALVYSFNMADQWVPAEEPLHRLDDAVDSFHWRRNPGEPKAPLTGEALMKSIAARVKGAGVGLPFALEMVRRTGVPIGLIPSAHGGTSMDQWSPSIKDQGGASLYGGMLRRFRATGGRIAGVLWYQGESDANPKLAPVFAAKFQSLIESIRVDFQQPDLPFYYVQIGRHVNNDNIDEWHVVQDAQRRVEGLFRNVGMTTAIDLELDDGIHVGTDAFPALAVRLANLAEGKIERGPRPVRARLDGSRVLVEFTSVNGHLRHTGRLNGFTIHDAEGRPVPLIYRQRILPGPGNTVELLFGGKLPANARLHYGYGKDPYLNLMDSAGMPCPVFGPLAIE
jgi:sialate O-acetylesterase